MQMLAAGGADVLGEWPAYEPPEAMFGNRILLQGKTAKMLDPHRDAIPFNGRVRAIWLTRTPPEQAASQAKFGQILMGLPNDRRTRKAYERSYMRDWPKAREVMRWWLDTDAPVLAFEDMIRQPEEAAMGLCDALDLPALDIAKMAAAVRPRTPGCYAGLLEAEMIAA